MKNILVLHLFSSRLFSFRAPRNCVSIQILIIAIVIISQREYITRILYPLMLHNFNPIMNTAEYSMHEQSASKIKRIRYSNDRCNESEVLRWLRFIVIIFHLFKHVVCFANNMVMLKNH